MRPGVVLLAGALLIGGFAVPSLSTAGRGPDSRSSPSGVKFDEPGWRVDPLREMAEEVNSLATHPSLFGRVFVGTNPQGGVFVFNAEIVQTTLPLALGLGDRLRHGLCFVNRLEIRDLDGDGTPELLASTSQIEPPGRPRLYVWSLNASPELRGIARPAIRSHWSHGLAFLDFPGSRASSPYITFCGNGEIVEYHLGERETATGFQQDSLGWRVAGQLPASGEMAISADADNDGRAELCVATGFAEGRAAIHFYTSDGPGSTLNLARAIDEGGRFGNVRFLVGDITGAGIQEVIAWWCALPDGGDCEVIRYRVNARGIQKREVIGRGNAGDLWPDDGQSIVFDLDGDGRPEVWFATRSGNLWRYDPARSARPARVLRFDPGPALGPIVRGPVLASRRPSLLLGRGRFVLRLWRS
jgi:hypothetical protein